jgi:hypothetical protein
MSASKQRDRKCATCRHYQPSPLWRKGWCRNPLLFDPSTNHLVEADKLSCQRAFIDYWEARAETDKPLIGPVVTDRPRVAPSIPLMPTGPGGAPLRPPSAARVATAEVLSPARDKPPLSLVRPPPDMVEEPLPVGAAPRSGDTTPLAPGNAVPTAAISIQGVTEPPPAPARPEAVEGGRPRLLLVGGVALVLLVLLVVLVARIKPGLLPGFGAPTALPTATVAVIIPPLPPTATVPPTAVPTLVPAPPPPPAPALAVGGTAQVVNTGGSSLRIRQAPNTTARILAKMPDGARLQLKGGPQQDAAKHTWWQVTGFDNKGTLGWCIQDYLKPVP